LVRSIRRLEGLTMGIAVSRSEPIKLVSRGECRDFGDEGSEMALPDAGSRNRIRGFVIMPNSC
jgi:hypothetical protein